MWRLLKMARPKKIVAEDVQPEKVEGGKYRFKFTYCGKYGFFKEGEVYELNEEAANVLKEIIERC